MIKHLLNIQENVTILFDELASPVHTSKRDFSALTSGNIDIARLTDQCGVDWIFRRNSVSFQCTTRAWAKYRKKFVHAPKQSKSYTDTNRLVRNYAHYLSK